MLLDSFPISFVLLPGWLLFTIPAAQTAGQEPHFHPAVWLIHGHKQPEGAGVHRLPKSPLGKQHCQTTGHKLQLTPLWDTPNTRRGMAQTGGDTTLTRAWLTAAAPSFHTQQSSGPWCSSPAPAAEQILGSHYSEKN